MSDLLRKLRIEQLLSDVDDGALSFVEYQRFAVGTDKTKDFAPGLSGISFLSLGLFGEVGSLLSELKKKIRDKEAYSSFRRVQMEEFGDVLWYPIAAPQLFLGDGAALFQAIGRARLAGQTTPIHLHLGVEYKGEPPVAVYFCGRRRALTAEKAFRAETQNRFPGPPPRS